MVKKINMDTLNQVAMFLVFVGGINWGLIGLFNFNLVETLFSNMLHWLVNTTYVAVGICAGWLGWQSIN